MVVWSSQVDCLHVWRAKNPINDLIYGVGGVKLFPKKTCNGSERLAYRFYNFSENQGI